MKKYSITKLARAYALLADRYAPQDLARGFVHVLKAQRQRIDFDIFSEEVANELAKKRGVALATVRSARPVSQETKKRIILFIQKTEHSAHMQIEYILDPSLIGGAIIQTATHTYTFSIAEKIKTIV